MLRLVLIAVGLLVLSWAILIVLARRLPAGAAKDLATVLPACATTVRRLRRDPRVPRRAQVAVALAGLWVLSPIDLIPEFIPVIGPVDDVIVVAIALRYAARQVPCHVCLRLGRPSRASSSGSSLGAEIAFQTDVATNNRSADRRRVGCRRQQSSVSAGRRFRARRAVIIPVKVGNLDAHVARPRRRLSAHCGHSALRSRSRQVRADGASIAVLPCSPAGSATALAAHRRRRRSDARDHDSGVTAPTVVSFHPRREAGYRVCPPSPSGGLDA